MSNEEADRQQLAKAVGEEPQHEEKDQEISSHDDNEDDGNDDGDSSSSSSSSNNGAEDDALKLFASDAEAEACRTEAVRLYNAKDYSKSLELCYNVVRYFSKKYGSILEPGTKKQQQKHKQGKDEGSGVDSGDADSAKVNLGKYFVDYGLCQLRLIQTTDYNSLVTAAATTAGNNDASDNNSSPKDDSDREEDVQSCFINLEVGRVNLRKREDYLFDLLDSTKEEEKEAAASRRQQLLDDYVENQLLLGDCHNALAQLYNESENNDAAIQEYEAELFVYKSLNSVTEEMGGSGEQQKRRVPLGRYISAIYGIADSYTREADFAGAAAFLKGSMDECRDYHGSGDSSTASESDRQLLEELEELYQDAVEMSTNDEYKKIQAEIQKQFAAEESDSVPLSAEFFEQERKDKEAMMEKHPFISEIGGGKMNTNSLSMPISTSGAVLGSAGNSISHNPFVKPMGTSAVTNENSCSLSHFPKQGVRGGSGTVDSNTNSNNVVQKVSARKKAKAPVTDDGDACSQPPEKKAKTE